MVEALTAHPEIGTAAIAAGVAFFTSLIAAYFSHRSLKMEYALEFAAERLVKKILTVENWEWRTFDAIKRVIGGFDDDALRQILVRSGAFRGYTRDGKVEMWSHISTNPNAFPPAGEPAGQVAHATSSRSEAAG
ncbi:MAG: hypothetical protein ACKOQM_01730 [Novosphingobium sp.]